MHDIETLADIKILVDAFYTKVGNNPLIGPVFHGVLKQHWQPHMEKMYQFWQTVLLEEYTYNGRPFPPHAELPISKDHFDQWLALFNETLKEHFQGPKADEAYWRAEKMAIMFMSKIAYRRGDI